MPRKLYRFGGMTFVLEADSPIADSPMCEPFRVGAGEPADHTVRLTFSDRVPDPPQNALRQGPLYRWYTGSARCTLQRYSAPGRTPQFTYAETRPGHTDLVFAESYRTGASARVVLESAGLFDILADAGMLVLHSAYIVTRRGEGILFSGPSGIGKSTQAALWQRYGAAQTVNGDRALVRPDTGTVSGVMYAGTSGICRILARIVYPSSPGSMMSSRIRSGIRLPSSSNSCSPFSSPFASNPVECRVYTSSSRIFLSSSTQ